MPRRRRKANKTVDLAQTFVIRVSYELSAATLLFQISTYYLGLDVLDVVNVSI
jgi:hypothetical protein